MQSCQGDSLTFEELQSLAGKWDRYPVPEVTAPTCPVCRQPLPPLHTYCSRECYYAGQKRAIWGKATRREPDEIADYSFPILPTQGDR